MADDREMNCEAWKNILEIIKNATVIIGIIVGAIFLGDPLIKIYDLRLKESEVKRVTSTLIDMHVEVLRAQVTDLDARHIVALVSIENDGLDTLEIPTIEPTLFISRFNSSTGRYESVAELEIFEGDEIVEQLTLQPGSRQSVSYAQQLSESGVYRVLFKIAAPGGPIGASEDESGREAVWSYQTFALVE